MHSFQEPVICSEYHNFRIWPVYSLSPYFELSLI